MSREDSPCIDGDYWLDKRRNGRSPDTWQIAWYDTEARTIVYRSTKCRTVDEAGARAALHAFAAAERSKQRGQKTEEAQLLAHLFNYVRERGPEVKRLDTVKSSFRAWIGFLQQDELGTGAFVADMTKTTLSRFRRWRMGPHSYVVQWGGKTFKHKSDGVTGEAVQRNIEDLRAALNHAEGEGRLTAPRIFGIERKFRSQPRQTVLSIETLGAMLAYASQTDRGAYRWLCLILATGCRPGVALAFDAKEQWLSDVLDMHPGGERTNKRNAVVPIIPPLLPVLTEWRQSNEPPVKSRKKWWGTMRRALGLGPEITAYTIRRTVATWLDNQGVPGADISGITGHLPSSRGVARITSRHYLAYDPRNCPKAVDALCKLYEAAQASASQWSAVHMLCKPSRGQRIEVAVRPQEC